MKDNENQQNQQSPAPAVTEAHPDNADHTIHQYDAIDPLYEENPKIVAHVSRTSKWLLNAITKLKTELEPLKETS
jgi:hypothetical protein